MSTSENAQVGGNQTQLSALSLLAKRKVIPTMIKLGEIFGNPEGVPELFIDLETEFSKSHLNYQHPKMKQRTRYT